MDKPSEKQDASMNASVTLTYPFSTQPEQWLRAVSALNDGRSLEKRCEDRAVDGFIGHHALTSLDSRDAIVKAINLYRARVLLRLKDNRATEDIKNEYQALRLTLCRCSDFDRSIHSCLDDLEPADFDQVIEIAKELLNYAGPET